MQAHLLIWDKNGSLLAFLVKPPYTLVSIMHLNIRSGDVVQEPQENLYTFRDFHEMLYRSQSQQMEGGYNDLLGS